MACSLLAVSALAGCGSSATEPGVGAAQVRFVVLAEGTPAMDVAVGGSSVAYGLGYESVTSYLPVAPGAAVFAANRSGDGSFLTSAQENLQPGHEYTVIVGRGRGANLQETLYADHEQPAPAGHVHLRVLTMVHSPVPLTFYLTPLAPDGTAGPLLALPLSFAESSSYKEQPAGSYTVTATLPEAGLNVPVGTVTLKAGSGAVRTVIFAGNVDENRHAHVVGFTLPDADGPPA